MRPSGSLWTWGQRTSYCLKASASCSDEALCQHQTSQWDPEQVLLWRTSPLATNRAQQAGWAQHKDDPARQPAIFLSGWGEVAKISWTLGRWKNKGHRVLFSLSLIDGSHTRKVRIRSRWSEPLARLPSPSWFPMQGNPHAGIPHAGMVLEQSGAGCIFWGSVSNCQIQQKCEYLILFLASMALKWQNSPPWPESRSCFCSIIVSSPWAHLLPVSPFSPIRTFPNIQQFWRNPYIYHFDSTTTTFYYILLHFTIFSISYPHIYFSILDCIYFLILLKVNCKHLYTSP